jgi:hypothetical protein
MKESLHLQRAPEVAPTDCSTLYDVNLRTVEHYRLVYGLDGEIDPELGV